VTNPNGLLTTSEIFDLHPTADLMTTFYRNLGTNPNKAQALRQAMLTTMKNHSNPID
jgi:CHAT domain-containing protein